MAYQARITIQWTLRSRPWIAHHQPDLVWEVVELSFIASKTPRGDGRDRGKPIAMQQGSGFAWVREWVYDVG